MPDFTPKKRSDGEWTAAFLANLKNSANVRAACKAAKVSRRAAYDRRDADPTFAAAWKDALADAIDELERVARKRAREQSDTLLIFLLKSHRPEVYRDQLKLLGPGKGGEIVVVNLGPGQSIEDL